MSDDDATTIHREPHATGIGRRLNWLRAGVLGANDGIVSIAGLVVGVAAVTPETSAVLVAGVSGLAAGAVSMALGEYVSVSTQRDTEKALIAKETAELATIPEEELEELVGLLEAQGLSPGTARIAAAELTAKDPLAAHARLELGIDHTELTNPWAAALSSAVAFTIGALLPLVAVLLAPTGARVGVAFATVLVALGITGLISARVGGAHPARAIVRLVVGGGLGLAVTYGISALVGVGV